MSKTVTYLSNMLFWVSPHKIVYCTPSSKYTDLNQHEKDRDHPHAFYDRGYFYEDGSKGKILSGDWDRATLEFSSLLEYKALYEHINGIEKWRYSMFASRIIEYYMSKPNKELAYRFQDFKDSDEFIVARESQIDALIQGIKDNGVLPAGGEGCGVSKLDDISANLSHTGDLIFNNRGHHRLAIAKILNIKLVPVQIIVWHSNNFL